MRFRPLCLLECFVVALMSCTLLLYLKAPRDADGSCWSILSDCRLHTFPIEQLRRTEKIIENESINTVHGKLLSGLNNKNEESEVNVTNLVLQELREGFFAAIREDTNTDSSLDNTVCVSEPTVLECLEIGFAALLLATLDHVSYCRMLGISKVTIHWKNCQSCCAKDPHTNSWPAFFEPLNTGTELNANKVLCLGGIIVGRVLASESAKSIPHFSQEKIKHTNGILRRSSLLDVGFRKRQSLPGYEEGAVITPELRRWVHGLISEHVRPQRSVQTRVDQFYMKYMHGYNALGVHVRATDHEAEMEEKKLPAMEKWLQDAAAIFETLQEPKKIFLASDNNEIIDRFVEHFEKDKVVYTAAIRASKYHSPHPINGQFTNDTDVIETGSQVLIDILLLAKCGHFLHAESSVATLASFFNPEMKLHFLGNLEDNVNVENSDLTKTPFPDPNEDTEVDWENDDWEDQIESLTWCYRANSPYSACPNMATGQLIDAKEVRTYLSQ